MLRAGASDDRESIKSATAGINSVDSVSTVVFRHYRGDGTLAWVESKFKLATEPSDPARTEFLCVIRDVTERKRMEDELTQLNRRLTQLAATDGLTGLTNRRAFDGFLRREYETCEEIAVLLFDIDSFKVTTTPTDIRPATVACRRSQGRSVMRPPIRRACPRVMAARNSPSCCAYNGRRRPEGRREHSADDSGLGIPNTASSRGYITISAGVAARSRSTIDEAALVGEADTALYEAKRLGRNRSILYSSLDMQYVESESIQHDGEFTPAERTR